MTAEPSPAPKVESECPICVDVSPLKVSNLCGKHARQYLATFQASLPTCPQCGRVDDDPHGFCPDDFHDPAALAASPPKIEQDAVERVAVTEYLEGDVMMRPDRMSGWHYRDGKWCPFGDHKAVIAKEGDA